MATNLVDYIKVYDNVVDEEFCKNVISTFRVSDIEYFDRQQRPSFTEFNITQRYLAKAPEWKEPQERIQKHFVDCVQLYMKKLDLGPDFPEKYAFEEFRMKMYNNNDYDEFKDHVDVGNHDSARRFLVCFLYLNDVAIGGQTEFPKLDHAVAAKCGRIVMFPATWQYRHAGRQPKNTQKYIVGSYLHYL